MDMSTIGAIAALFLGVLSLAIVRQRQKDNKQEDQLKTRIKELRKQQGYRQEDLAEALNVSRQTIIAIENDKYNPTLELAMKLARYLNTTVVISASNSLDVNSFKSSYAH